MNFFMPVKLYTGPNCLFEYADLIASYGKNA